MIVNVLDRNLRVLYAVDRFISFIWTERYWDYGDFEIEVPLTKENMDIFQIDRYVAIPDSEKLMIIETLTKQRDENAERTLIVSGRSLESILDRRLVWGQKNIDGSIQTSIQTLLNENVISPSDANRKIDNIMFEASEDQTILSKTVTVQLYYDNLLDSIVSILQKAGFGFKLVPNLEGKFVFSIFNGADRTYDQTSYPYVIFSTAYGNLLDNSFVTSKQNYKTFAVVAGEGTGNNRTTTTYNIKDTLTGLDRRELFVDAADIQNTGSNYTKELQNRASDELNNNYGEDKTYDGSVTEKVNFIFNQDYYIGDIVQVEGDFQESWKCRIVEYIRKEDRSGTDSYPSFTILDDEEEEEE